MLGYDTEEIRSFWKRACAALGINEDTPYCAYTFAEPSGNPKVDPIIDELAEYALEGRKRGTAHLEMHFEIDNIARRNIGDYWIVLKVDGTPLCVVQIIGVAVTPFRDISPVFAASEGEGDLSLRHWRGSHLDYFVEQCERWGVEWSEDHPVVCESFIPVYKPEGTDA